MFRNNLVNEDNVLLDSTKLEGVVATPYTTISKSFNGYTLSSTPANNKGSYTEEDQLVVYKYTKIKKDSVETINVKVNHIYNNKLNETQTKKVNLNVKTDLSAWLKPKLNNQSYKLDYIEVVASKTKLSELKYEFTATNNAINIYYTKDYSKDSDILPTSGDYSLIIMLFTLTSLVALNRIKIIL